MITFSYGKDKSKKATMVWRHIATGSCAGIFATDIGLNPSLNAAATVEEIDDIFESAWEAGAKHTFGSATAAFLGIANGGTLSSLFLDWLIRTKKGIVCVAPLHANVNHGVGNNSTLCEMAILIPLGNIQRGAVVAGSGGLYNLDLLEKYPALDKSSTLGALNSHFYRKTVVNGERYMAAADWWKSHKEGLIKKINAPLSWKKKA